jgi:hypothetical protein
VVCNVPPVFQEIVIYGTVGGTTQTSVTVRDTRRLLSQCTGLLSTEGGREISYHKNNLAELTLVK